MPNLSLLVCAILLSPIALAASTVDPYTQQYIDLVTTHRTSLTRLTSPAMATAQGLIGGGSLFIANNSDPAWSSEALSPAGGILSIRQYVNSSSIGAGSVVWLSYSAKSYDSARSLASAIEQMKGIAVAFGPQPPGGPPAFTNWVNSLTPWTADDDLTLFGNVLSLWSFTGEVAAAATRQGKTLAFSESPSLPGSDVRNAHYQGLLFHAGLPQMQVTQAGTLSAAYLDYVAAMLGRITGAELLYLSQIAQVLKQRMSAGSPAIFTAQSRLIPFVPSLAGNSLLQFLSDSSKLNSVLNANSYLVHLGYDEANLDLWRTVRLKPGAQASWINVHLPSQADLTYYRDTVVDEHLDFGDCTVQVPNYDVCILPASGLAQLLIYELLLHAN